MRKRFRSQGIPIYQLKDLMDEDIQGTFYSAELVKVSKDEDAVWRIDKIIKKRKVKGKELVFVHWLGWPKKFRSWNAAKDIKAT